MDRFTPVVWLLFPFLLFGLVLLVVLFAVLFLVRSEHQAAGEGEAPVRAAAGGPDEKVKALRSWESGGVPSEAALKREVLDARGGLVALQGFRSIRVEGVLKKPDSEDAGLFLLKKAPRQALIKVDRDGLVSTLGVSGSSFWRRLTNPLGETLELSLEDKGDYSASHDRMALFHDPLVHHALTGEGRIRLIDRTEWRGRDFLRVELELPDMGVFTLRVDPETFLTVAEEIVRVEDGQRQRSLFLFDDWRRVGELVFPFRTEFRVNDELIHRIQLEKAEINPFVLSGLFSPPEALSEEGEEE